MKNKKEKNKSNSFVPFITSLLFGLHPIHTDAVTSIIASIDTTGLMFYLLSFWLYLKKSRFSLIFASLAFFTYEMTLTLPIMIIFYDYLFSKNQFKKRNLINLFKVYSPYFLVEFIFVYIRFFVLNIVGRGEYLGDSFLLTMMIMTRGIIKYMELLIWPFNLSLNHTLDKGIYALSYKDFINTQTLKSYTILNPKVIINITIIFSLFLFGLKNLRKAPVLVFGIGWFFISLLPVLFFIPQGEIIAERYLYLSSFGFCLVSGLFFNFLLKYKTFRVGLIIILITLFTAYGVRIYLRNQDWKDTLTVWKVLVSQNPEDVITNYNLADLYAQQGNNQLAITYLKKTLLLSDNFSQAHYRLGQVYESDKRQDLARKEFQRAVILNPNYIEAKKSLSYLANFYHCCMGLSIYYPEDWELIKTQKGAKLKQKDKSFQIEVEAELIENKTKQEYIDSQSQLGKLINQGLAQVPQFDYSFVKSWKNDVSKLQFFLFKDDRVVSILVYPTDTKEMDSFNQILRNIQMNPQGGS